MNRHPLQSLRRHARRFALLALIACLPMMNGCYGAFPLTKAVYKFNGEASPNEFVQTVVFWVFSILPVYGGAMFIDAVVLNAIEFWSGNTIDVSSAPKAAPAEASAEIETAQAVPAVP